MDRIQVESSNVRSIGYDAQSMTLEVEFVNGNIYQYFDVPEALYQAFMAAESRGQFLNLNVKGSYRYARL